MAFINTSRGKLKYKDRIIYLGIKQIDKEKSLKNLICVHDIMERNKVRYGLMYGTLLGAVREHDFITWDEDIDLFVISEDEGKLKDSLWELLEQGFTFLRYDRTGIYTVVRDGEYIDFYIFEPYSEGIRHAGCNRKFFPDELFVNTVLYEFKGYKFPIPQNYEKLLEIEYGKNWMTPIKMYNYEMPKYKRALRKLVFYVRNHMPKFVYEAIAKHKHRMNKEIFNRKFKDAGYENLVIK